MNTNEFFAKLDALMDGIKHPYSGTVFDSITSINTTMRTFDIKFIDNWDEQVTYTIPFDIAFDPEAITKFITEFDAEEERKQKAAREAKQKISDEAEYNRLKAKLGK